LILMRNNRLERVRAMQTSMTASESTEWNRSSPLAGARSSDDQHSKPRALSLPRNVAWSAVGNIAYAATQWGILIVLARLGTTEMVGQYALGLAVTGPVFMLANLQLRVIQATDIQEADKFGDHLALRLATSTAALAVISVLVLVGGFRPGTVAVIIGVGLLKALESLSEIIYGLLQNRERMDRIAAMQSLKGGLALVAMVIGVTATGKVFAGVALMLCAWTLGQILFEWPSALWALGPGRSKDLMPHWNLPKMRKLAWRALPLGIVMMLASLFVNFPRYAIERSLGESTLGVYSAIAYLIVAGGTITNSLGQAASPRLAKRYSEGDLRSFDNLLSKIGGLGLLVGLAGIVVAIVGGKAILTVVYGAGYADHVELFTWIMIASAVANVASPLGYGMTAAGYYKVQLPLFVLVVIASAASSYRLVPRYGLIGGAWALLIAYGVLLLGSLAVLLWDRKQRSGARL
jgi:O-antigen/teichoic acid export membrane protein